MDVLNAESSFVNKTYRALEERHEEEKFFVLLPYSNEIKVNFLNPRIGDIVSHSEGILNVFPLAAHNHRYNVSRNPESGALKVTSRPGADEAISQGLQFHISGNPGKETRVLYAAGPTKVYFFVQSGTDEEGEPNKHPLDEICSYLKELL